MNKSFVVLTISVLLILANFIMPGKEIDFYEGDDVMVISPYNKKTEYLMTLYFVHGTEYITETRNVSVDIAEKEIAALEALKSGPKISVADAPILSDVDIISVENIDRTSYVSLSSEFKEDEHDMLINIMAIVNTLTEFDDVDDVQILIHGNKIDGQDYDLDIPLSRDTSNVQSIELTHRDIAKKFMNYIVRSRYDLAYDLIDSQSKNIVTFDEFVEDAKRIKEEINGYSINYVFVEEIYGGHLINMKYQLYDIDDFDQILIEEKKVVEKFYSWHMLKEEGLWRIKLIS